MSVKHPNAVEIPASEETSRQLLEAASEVFARRGYRATTVREICRLAGANVAAVNYHYGGKEGLYAGVMHYAHQCAYEKYPPDLGLRIGATAEQRLEAFVRSFLLRIFGDGREAWHGKLMAHEMIEPTSALDTLVEERIRPMSKQLGEIVGKLLQRPAGDKSVRMACLSIVGQCLFYHHCKPVISRLFPDEVFGASDVDRLASHITRFSLAALGVMAKDRLPAVRAVPRRLADARRK